MQEASTIPHTLWDLARTLLVAFLVAAITYFFTRKKSNAETRKADAETNHILLSDQLAHGQLLVELMTAGAKAVQDTELLRRQKEFQHDRGDRLEAELEAVRVERDLLQDQLDKYIRIGKGGNGKSTS